MFMPNDFKFIADSLQPTVCVTGATGFIGMYVLPLLQQSGARIRVLSRSGKTELSDVDIFVGDLFDKASLVRFMQGANLLINLAQPTVSLSDERFAVGISNLACATKATGIRRLLHISTAMVIGAQPTVRVTEETPCLPITAYERQKFNAEQVLRSAIDTDVDFGILRPTAVFGDGGLNLLKMAAVIARGSEQRRRLLRFLHGKRRMHLVSVRDVADAVTYLAFFPQPLAGNVFIISADHEPANNYQAVDAILGTAMGKPSPSLSASIPNSLLTVLLRLTGRSQANPELVYDASKIRNWGFRSRCDFADELKEFAVLYTNKGNR